MLPLTARIVLPLLMLLAAAGASAAEPLKPHKDRLFAYPGVLEQSHGGAYRVVDYQELRDINGRDEVPERRAHGQYVSLKARSVQSDLSIQTDAGTMRHFAVGRTERARMIVLYLHGQGGSRRQGVDDFSFGGNFNRVKNLMADNGGLYLVPDLPDFGKRGTAGVAALIDHYRARSPGAPVFVACGSMGGAICWALADDARHVRAIDGIIMLGSMWDDNFLRGPGFARRLPVFIGHGSRDKVFPVDRVAMLFRAMLARDPFYPARFVRFETGTHGTPIRMTDWRETLNWMVSVRRAN